MPPKMIVGRMRLLMERFHLLRPVVELAMSDCPLAKDPRIGV